MGLGPQGTPTVTYVATVGIYPLDKFGKTVPIDLSSTPYMTIGCNSTAGHVAIPEISIDGVFWAPPKGWTNPANTLAMPAGGGLFGVVESAPLLRWNVVSMTNTSTLALYTYGVANI